MVRFGILDHDAHYAHCLVNFFSARCVGQVEPFLFHSKQALLDALGSRRLDLILASPQLIPDPGELPSKVLLAYLSEEKDVEQINRRPAVFRYQRGEILLRQIKGLAARQDDQRATYAASGRGVVLTFLGAGGGTGCSNAAMGCACALAGTGKKVLYLCLQNNGYVGHCLSGEGSGDLTRVLYEVKSYLGDRERQGNLAAKLEGLLKYEVQLRFHYYDTFSLPLEAASVTAQELELLLTTLSGLFDVVVADMDGIYSPVLGAALQASAHVLLVSDGSPCVNQRLKQMVKTFSILDDSEDLRLLSRTQILYNRFGSRARQATLDHTVQVLGTIDNFSGTDARGIVQELGGRTLFMSLLGT